MGETFADYMKSLGYTDQDLATNGFWQTNSNGNGYGFLGFEDPSQSTKWLGKGGIIDTGLGIGQLVLGGLGAWNAMNQLDLARQQTGFARDAFNAQLGNSVFNLGNAAANARRVAFALQGSYAPKVFGTKSQQQAGEDYRKEVTSGLTSKV